MKSFHWSRRKFLIGVGSGWMAAAARTALGQSAVPPKHSANDRLNIVLIGAGSRGQYLAAEALRLGENLVALCDVDAGQLDTTRRYLSSQGEVGTRAAEKARLYEDYRKLLDDSKLFDAVLIATGARWHAPIAMAMMKAGKHVYCEKPLVRTLTEARQLAELARTTPVATQTGTQGCSVWSTRRAIDVLRAGLLGPIREVYLWCDYYGPNPPSHDAPAGEDPIPQGLNWDFWLGPVPYRPYKKDIYHPGCLKFQNWLFMDNGMLAGQGAHTFPLAVLGLELGPPVRVETELPEPLRETYPSKAYFKFEFAARGNQPPVTLWWTDGGRYPPEEVTQDLKAGLGKTPQGGLLFRGEKGQLYAAGWGGEGILKLQGDKKWRGVLDHEAAKAVPVSLPRLPGDNHMQEWLSACRGGPKPFSCFETGARIAEVFLPGILALRLNRPIQWDAQNLKVPDAPEADQWIQNNYRTKWLI
ncbi:MAG: Gfo/Idh/MocA family oxidoreductase [Thermoguttaceae bacterium]|nr:Gfo/Idh/MocA family oxidoreductase [Thermoguttaceae bacterium]MDW8037699.1 Gfo/Idh/MocA family oxidoreductase [Thermoguttaceae bacterium]